MLIQNLWLILSTQGCSIFQSEGGGGGWRGRMDTDDNLGIGWEGGGGIEHSEEG